MGPRQWPRTKGGTAAVVVGLTVVGAVLRLLTLGTRSFWLDETTAVRQASWTVPQIIQLMADNVHPPFFHVLLHYWILVFGKSEIAVRAFPVTWGIAAIPLVYWVGRNIYDRRVGVIATAIVALAPYYIWYSQEARMYTMMLVFALLSVLFMWKAMASNRVGWWIGYSLATAAGLMTQYFFFFLVLGQAIYFLLFKVARKESELAEAGTRRMAWSRPWGIFRDVPETTGWLLALVVAALPSAWWLPKVLAHKDLFRGIAHPFNYGGVTPTLGVHFNDLILVPVEMAFGFHSTVVMRDLVAMWPLLITLAFVTVGFARPLTQRTWYLIASGIGGATVIALIGQWQPILEARYFTAATTPVLFLVARLLAGLKPLHFRVTVAALLAITLVGVTDQSFDPNSIVKWDNRQAMGIISSQFQPGDVVLLIPYFVSSIPEYYLSPQAYQAVRKVPSFDQFGNLRNTPQLLGQDLNRQVGPATRVWVIATWQDVPRIALDRVNTGGWLLAHGYRVAEDYQLHQIRVTLYERAVPRPFLPPAQQFFVPQPGKP